MTATNFKDIFKSNFLNNVTSVSVPDMAIAFVFTLAIGLFIFLVYKKSCTSIMYSTSFGLTIISLSLVTTLVILAVTSNVVLSLGMVGALSIVRFRTAIKEPMEIVFLFWSIAVGIVIGAGFFPLAVIGSGIVGIIIIILANKKSSDMPYIIVISMTDDSHESEVKACLDKNTEKNTVRTKTVNSEYTELTCEIRLKDDSTAFVNSIKSISGIRQVSLVSFNGDYMV